MARLTIPVKEVYGSRNPANSGAVTAQTVDAANGHQWLFEPGDMLFFWHSDAGTKAITLVGVADPTGRIESAVISGTSGLYPIGPLNPEGWVQPDGYVHVNSSDTGSIAVFVLRNVRRRT